MALPGATQYSTATVPVAKISLRCDQNITEVRRKYHSDATKISLGCDQNL